LRISIPKNNENTESTQELGETSVSEYEKEEEIKLETNKSKKGK